MIFRCFVLAFALSTTALHAEKSEPDGVRVLTDLPYKQGDALSEYEKERCKLDVYLPATGKSFASLVWFHGGGLINGDKDGRQIKSDSVKTSAIARSLASAGLAVVSVNYQLSPKVKFPAYIQDAAAAVSWTREHIGEHGGDPQKLFVGGHSAGGYLTLMLGMDAHYFSDVGVKMSDIAGFIPLSGQVMTHYTVLSERDLGKYSVMADEAAPVHFARAETQPFLVLYADHDMAARAEENAYFVALMKGAGNKRIDGHLLTDRTHGSIASKIVDDGDSARALILEFIKTKSTKH